MPSASQPLAESKAAVHSVLQKVKNDTYTIKHTSDSSNTADSDTADHTAKPCDLGSSSSDGDASEIANAT